MASLDEVLNGTARDEANHHQAAEVVSEVPAGETAAEVPATGESQVEGDPAGEGAPPAPETGTNVPLKALEAERAQRQDWKEKAIRSEERTKQLERDLEALRAQQQQPQAQQQPAVQDQGPLSPDMALLNERFNISEMIARRDYPDMDDKIAVFQAEAAKNPALGAQLAQQRHPYDWLYKQAQRIEALNEIGDDPTAYQAKVREKIEAELKAAAEQPAESATGQPTQNALVLPKSLATSRSAGPRSAPTWTGPTPLDNILKR